MATSARSSRTVHTGAVRPSRLGRHRKPPSPTPPAVSALKRGAKQGVSWVPPAEFDPDAEPETFDDDTGSLDGVNLEGYVAKRLKDVPSNKALAESLFAKGTPQLPEDDASRDYDPSGGGTLDPITDDGGAWTFIAGSPPPPPTEASLPAWNDIQRKAAMLIAQAKAEKHSAPIALRTIVEQDVDRLWDWLRDSADDFKRAFGIVPTSSRMLFQMLERLVAAEQLRTAMIRAIELADSQDHLGFVFLLPITQGANGPSAMVHLFLAPDARGFLPQMLPYLLRKAEEEIPGVTLSITTHEPAFSRLLQRFGFVESIVLTRPPQLAYGAVPSTGNGGTSLGMTPSPQAQRLQAAFRSRRVGS